MKTETSLSEVLSHLAGEGLMKPLETDAMLAPAPVETRGSSLPWYVKLFIGISAWIAAILITAFFFIVGFIDENQALGFGLVFCALAIGLNRLGRGNTFWVQLALAASLTGQVLAIIGLISLFDLDESAPIVVSIVILEAILIWLHRDTVLRFISTLVITSSILWLVLEPIFGQGTDSYFFLYLYIIALAAITVAIYLMEHRLKIRGLGEVISPVGAAVVVFFLGILVMPLSDTFGLNWQLIAVALAAMLAFLLSRVALDLGYNLRNRVVIALLVGCLLLLVPSLRMPGILAALIVLALGFWRNNRGLMGLSAIFLVFYIGAFYYSLEWTLLVKSLVLLASGVTLLALRYFVVRFTLKAGGEA